MKIGFNIKYKLFVTDTIRCLSYQFHTRHTQFLRENILLLLIDQVDSQLSILNHFRKSVKFLHMKC
jgi:hypothetical protein